MSQRIFNFLGTTFASITMFSLFFLAMIGMGGRPGGQFAHVLTIVFVASAMVTLYVLPWIPIKVSAEEI